MAALNFPSNPSIGDLDPTGSWQWDGSVWKAYTLSPQSAITSPTPPLNPSNGTIWYNTVDGTFFVYVNDGDSSQWVEVKANSAAAGTLGTRVDALETALTSYSPNYIINGAMDIWQRGVGPFTTSGGFSADRWNLSTSQSITQSTDIPNSNFTYSLRSVASAANYPEIYNRIESKDSTLFAGKTVTVSFYAKAETGTAGLRLVTYYPTASDNYATTTIDQNIAVTTSMVPNGTSGLGWNRYSATFTVSTNAKNGYAISLQRASASSSGVTLYTGVQLELGSTATAFRRNANSIQGELAACQRYYWRMATGTNIWLGTAYYYAASQVNLPVIFPVTMRTAPSLDVSNGTSHFYVDSQSSPGNFSTFSLFQPNTQSALLYTTAPPTGTIGKSVGIETSLPAAFIGFSAEL